MSIETWRVVLAASIARLVTPGPALRLRSQLLGGGLATAGAGRRA